MRMIGVDTLALSGGGSQPSQSSDACEGIHNIAAPQLAPAHSGSLCGGRSRRRGRGSGRVARVQGGVGGGPQVAGQRLDAARGHRPRDQVTLAEPAAHFLQQLKVLRPLDPLRDDLDAEVMPDLDDRAGEHGQGGIRAQARHERGVDLDDVSGKLPEVREGRVPGAEVVDGQPHAVTAKLRQASAIGPAPSIRTRSATSRVSSPGGRPLPESAVSTDAANPAAVTCRSEKFTETPIAQPEFRQAAACAHASRSTHSPSGTISPESSATLRNSAGGTACPSRDQRASASTPMTRDVANSTTGWYSSASRPAVTAARRSLAISSLRMTSACMCAAKTSTRPPPEPFARDIATSALRSRWPGAPLSAKATPMLAVREISRSATWNGSGAMAPPSRSAMSTMSGALAALSTSTANSSPPQRATVSCEGTVARRRRAAWASSRSPAPCPTESLTPVKPSRSMKIAPACTGGRPGPTAAARSIAALAPPP